MVDRIYSQKIGFLIKLQSVFARLLRWEAASRPFIDGSRGPVMMIVAIAIARRVFLYPYLCSRASMMNG